MEANRTGPTCSYDNFLVLKNYDELQMEQLTTGLWECILLITRIPPTHCPLESVFQLKQNQVLYSVGFLKAVKTHVMPLIRVSNLPTKLVCTFYCLPHSTQNVGHHRCQLRFVPKSGKFFLGPL